MKKFVVEIEERTRIIGAVVEAKDEREATKKFLNDFAHDYGYFPQRIARIEELHERGNTFLAEVEK